VLRPRDSYIQMNSYNPFKVHADNNGASQLNKGDYYGIACLNKRVPKKARFQLLQNLASEEGDEKLYNCALKLRFSGLDSILYYNRKNSKNFFNEIMKHLIKNLYLIF